MSATNTLKDLVLNEVKVTCRAISQGFAIARHGIGSQIHLQITYGMFQKLKLAADKDGITGIRGFRSSAGGPAVDVKQKNWEKAWRCVPEDQKVQLTEFLLSRQSEIEVRCVYKVYYKGIAIGRRLDQGLTLDKKMSFPKSLGKNRFKTNKDAQQAAMSFGAYIKGLQQKKDNFNHD